MRCPICETKQGEEAKICTVCGYDLTPYPVVLGQIPLAFLEKEKERISWCKELWQNYKSELKKSQVAEARVKELEEKLEKIQGELIQKNNSRSGCSGNNKPKTASLDLTSKVSRIDYSKLRQLLSEKKWREADLETANKIWQVMNRQQEKFLRSEDIKAFPEEDLKIIDSLWFEYSDGKFGFRVQNRIWQASDNPKNRHKHWNYFAENIGWKGKFAWKIPQNIYTEENFREGSLPFAWWGDHYWSVLKKTVFEQGISDWISLVSKLSRIYE